MKAALILAALLAPSLAMAQAEGDQTADVARVASYLVALRIAPADARAMLSDAVVVIDSETEQPRTLDQFVTFANGCRLRNVLAVPEGTKRLPIGANWYCRGGEQRSAAFWFDGDKISKISWGKPAVLVIMPRGNR